MVDGVALVVGIFSIALAIVSLWLSLYHKSKTDEVNNRVQTLLQQVSADAELMRTYALGQLTKVTDVLLTKVTDQPSAKAHGYEPTNDPGPQSSSSPDPSPLHERHSHTGIEGEPLMGELRTVVERIDEGDRFSVTDRDAAITLMRQIKNTQVEESPEFAILAERLLDNLVSADQHTYVDTLDEWFPNITTSHSGINSTLLLSLGYRLLGTISTPHTRDVRRFKRHMEHATENNNQTFALAIWIVYRFVEGDKHEVERTFERVESLDDMGRLAFLALLERMSEGSNIARTTTPRIMTMAANFRKFWESHQDRLDHLRPQGQAATPER